MNEFMDWCHSITPEWVGFIVFLSACILSLGFLFVAVLAVFITKGKALWVVPVVAAYAWYIALFGQP